MKNFKPQTHAPQGALCACKDRLGPHFFADGGSVDGLSDEDYLALVEKLRNRTTGRRREELNKSRGVNGAKELARGWVAGTLGLPGDIEGLGRMLLQPTGVTLPGPLGALQRAVPTPSETPTLPTADFYQEWLPGRDERPAAEAMSGLGALFGGAGVGAVARGVRKGSGAVAKGALETLRRGMEGSGPLAGVVAPAAPMYAIKPRGGNVDPEPMIRELLDRNRSAPTKAWIDKNLRNYVKRDLGAPTDPLLALEKELPGLHLQEDAWPTGQSEIDNLYVARQRGKNFPRLLEPENTEAGSNMARAATNYLNRHDELSGGAPLTRWGRAADSNIGQTDAGPDLAIELANKWPMGTMYPDLIYGDSVVDPLGNLLRHTDNILSRDPEGTSARAAKLREYRAMIADKMQSDWRAKTPDAPLYRPLMTAGEDLGFSHMTDYLDAATEPYNRLAQNFSISAGREPGGASDYAEASKKLFSFPDANAAYENFVEGMHPYRRQDIENWFRLRDAGLLVDPEALPRMGVADVSRKTAAWNEFLANQQGAGNEALGQGWKTFKEYGPEQGGMKWVEFGEPEGLTDRNLPEDVVLQKNPESGQWAVYGSEYAPGKRSAYSNPANTEEDALKQFWKTRRAEQLRSGLKAEGDVMGHCVGGYCDDVLERGTRIYSLRDAKGMPHVTVEVAPGRVTDEYLKNTMDPDYKPRGPFDPQFRTLHERVQDERSGNGDYEEYARKLVKQLGLEMPPDQIVQIKGKQNAAPVEKYLPFVQDFVRSGKWGRVGDLGNTGLSDISRLTRDPAEQHLKQHDLGDVTIGEINRWRDANPDKSYVSPEELSQFLGRPVTRRPRGYASGGAVLADEKPAPGFLPRNFEQWVDYAEQLFAPPNKS